MQDPANMIELTPNWLAETLCRIAALRTVVPFDGRSRAEELLRAVECDRLPVPTVYPIARGGLTVLWSRSVQRVSLTVTAGPCAAVGLWTESSADQAAFMNTASHCIAHDLRLALTLIYPAMFPLVDAETLVAGRRECGGR